MTCSAKTFDFVVRILCSIFYNKFLLFALLSLLFSLEDVFSISIFPRVFVEIFQ